MAQGRTPDRERRRHIIELRARGLTLAEIGRRLGVTRQAVHSFLKQAASAATRSVPCAGCGAAIVSPGALPSNQGSALCLPCLAKTPGVSLGQRLKALRLAAGLTRAEVERRAGVALGSVTYYEQDATRPRREALTRLARALPGLLDRAGHGEGE